jgi:diadenosine tetraphosphatase ApaH/serine/threonine PP2A family protein phosphatase
MYAFISDIHGNTGALAAVFEDIRSRRVDKVFCLGDVIGYGPEPRECLQTVMENCEICLLGNHEHGSMYYASDFNPKARAAIEWTKDELNSKEYAREENFKLWNYISEMPESHTVGEILLVHGSPQDPVREYLLPSDAKDEAKMAGCYAKMGTSRVCFVGHSHVPGLYVEGKGFQSPSDLDGEAQLDDSKAIVNIGSVGQPRDGDTRASYVTFDEKARIVRFHRLAYDVEATMAKLRATELPEYLADRLGVGR